MTKKIRLIHPIYLDVPMLVSFAAAIEGGVAFEQEVKSQQSSSTNNNAQISGKFGLSSLFSTIFDANVRASIDEQRTVREKTQTTESRGHTEASMAILLYDRLTNDFNSIIKPETHDALTILEPGALIEITGVLKKNAVDSVIDNIDAINLLSGLADSPAPAPSNNLRNKNPQTVSPAASKLENIRKILDDDRKRTPISNVLLECLQPSGCKAVLTLRTENLRDLTLSELHNNSVRVVGKITRLIGSGQSMSAFENYGMALLAKDRLEEMFTSFSNNHNLRTEYSPVEVEGPAAQILPLMIFV